MDLVGLGPTTRKSSLHYNINNSSLFQVASYIVIVVTGTVLCRYRACTTRCFHVRSSHVRTQKDRKWTWQWSIDSNVHGCLYVFSTQNIVWIVSELLCFTREGETPPPAPTPLVGPTTLQILATPLVWFSVWEQHAQIPLVHISSNILLATVL